MLSDKPESEWEFLDFTIEMQLNTLWFEQSMKKMEELKCRSKSQAQTPLDRVTSPK